MKKTLFIFELMFVTFMSNAQTCPDDNHPHAIDLGLPSRTKWACCNVGAASPDMPGGKYAWGETVEKEKYDWSTYVHCDGGADNCHDLGTSISGTEYDVAHAELGGKWQMPSYSQLFELLVKCSHDMTTYNGVYGAIYTGPNGNSIFLPALGYCDGTTTIGLGTRGIYWSGTPSGSNKAECLTFMNVHNTTTDLSRYCALPVRPVYYAAPFDKDGIHYTVLDDGKTVEVAKSQDYHGDIVIPETVENNGTTYTVTSIESWAFYQCRELKSLKLPKTLRSIGENAFWDCDNLKTVDIGDISNWCTIDFQGEYWFSNPISRYELEHLLVDGKEITDLVIPDDVEKISRNAFYWCPPIRSLEIPGTVKTIGEDAFYGSFNIGKVVLHEGIANIEKGGLANIGVTSITIPRSVKRLAKNSLNYENTSSSLKNVSLLNPDPDATILEDDLGLVSQELITILINVPSGSLDAYRSHRYWGQFNMVEGLKEDDLERIVRVDYFYVEEPVVRKGEYGLYAPTINLYPGYQGKGQLVCDFALGLYKDGELKYTSWRYADDWVFDSWKECFLSSSTSVYIYDIENGDYQMRMLYKFGDEELRPMLNSENVFVDVTVNDEEMVFHNRFLNGSQLDIDDFRINGMPKVGHDITFDATVTSRGLKRSGCLFLHVNDTARYVMRSELKPQETMDIGFAKAWSDNVFSPSKPGAYDIKVVDGLGEVVLQRELRVPEPETNELALAGLEVDNLYGMIVADEKNLSVKVHVKNVGESTYDDEIKFVTKSIWSQYENGDSLIALYDSRTYPLKIESDETATCSYGLIDYDYFEQTGKRPFMESYWGGKFVVEMYYYTEGKEVLLAKTPFYRWINPNDYRDGKILVEPIGYSREYGEKDPPIEYSVYGGTLDGVPHIYPEATLTSPARHYYIRCERGTVRNENVEFVDDVMAVQKAPLTVTVDSYAREEYEENPPFELSYSGFKLNETADVLTVSPIATTTADYWSPPGTYPITVSGGEAENYYFVYVGGILTIEQPSGIETPFADTSVLNVYRLDGQLIYKGVKNLNGIPKGIYIVNGKKCVVK